MTIVYHTEIANGKNLIRRIVTIGTARPMNMTSECFSLSLTHTFYPNIVQHMVKTMNRRNLVSTFENTVKHVKNRSCMSKRNN